MAFDLLEPAAADRFVTARDGLKLHVRDYAPAGAESGLPVICLHGLTRNGRDFERVAPRIAALGRRTLALDVRGRGHSDRDPKPENYAPNVYAADVLEVMDAFDVPCAVFVGTSMGGIITMMLAYGVKGRVAAAVLNDVGPVLEEKGLARIATYVGKTMRFASWDEAQAAVKEAQGAVFPHADDMFWAEFARRVCRQDADGGVSFDYDPAIARPLATTKPVDMTPLFEALGDAPVLVVRGALSDLLSGEGVELMRIVRPDLESVEVPGVGHAPTLEEEPAWLAMID
ncbi:MAG: alpha/beta fold hydrolase, partial [Hyphomonadaceae bacterium]